MAKSHWYRCARCKTFQKRPSTKQWVKSFCERTGKTTHLIRVSATQGAEIEWLLRKCKLEEDCEATAISDDLMAIMKTKGHRRAKG